LLLFFYAISIKVSGNAGQDGEDGSRAQTGHETVRQLTPPIGCIAHPSRCFGACIIVFWQTQMLIGVTLSHRLILAFRAE
jgi:hypothetical protein